MAAVLPEKSKLIVEEFFKNNNLTEVIESLKTTISTQPTSRSYYYYQTPTYFLNGVYENILISAIYKEIMNGIYEFKKDYVIKNPRYAFDDFRCFIEKKLYYMKEKEVITAYKTILEQSRNRDRNSYNYNRYNGNRDNKYYLSVYFSFRPIAESSSKSVKNYKNDFQNLIVTNDLTLENFDVNKTENGKFDWYFV